jgi:hypothetical protein
MLSVLNKKYTLYVFELFYSSANNLVYSETDLHVIEFYICISSGAVFTYILETWRSLLNKSSKFVLGLNKNELIQIAFDSAAVLQTTCCLIRWCYVILARDASFSLGNRTR